MTREPTFGIIDDQSLNITVRALCATVETRSGRGLPQFLTAEPFNGIVDGLDVKIAAKDYEQKQSHLLDLQALAEEAGMTYRIL